MTAGRPAELAALLRATATAQLLCATATVQQAWAQRAAGYTSVRLAFLGNLSSPSISLFVLLG